MADAATPISQVYLQHMLLIDFSVPVNSFVEIQYWCELWGHIFTDALFAGFSCHGETDREVHVPSKPGLGQYCEGGNKGKLVRFKLLLHSR